MSVFLYSSASLLQFLPLAKLRLSAQMVCRKCVVVPGQVLVAVRLGAWSAFALTLGIRRSVARNLKLINLSEDLNEDTKTNLFGACRRRRNECMFFFDFILLDNCLRGLFRIR